MIERTEKAVRAEIAKWPEGTWSRRRRRPMTTVLTLGRPVHVRGDLTIKNGELYFDFSKTDDQVAGMINSYYQQTLSNVLCTTFLFLGKDLAAYHNEGSMRPVHVNTRKGTIVDCKPGALVAGSAGGYRGPGHRGRSVAAFPGSARPGCQPLLPPRFSIDSREGTTRRTVSTSTPRSAPPPEPALSAGYDGYQCVCDMGTLGVVGKTDAEEEMARFPWDINQYEFRTDSHGAGQWRGAPGIIWEGSQRRAESPTSSAVLGAVSPRKGKASRGASLHP